MNLKNFAISLTFILAFSTTVLFAQSFSFTYSGPTSLTVPFSQNSVNGTYYFQYYREGTLIRTRLNIYLNGNMLNPWGLCEGNEAWTPESFTINFTPGTHTVRFELYDDICHLANLWQVEQFTVTCNFQIQIKNIFEQGIISVDNVNRNSPYNRTTIVNQNIPFGAIDQDYDSYNRKWNTSENNLSFWDRERFGNGIWELQNWNRNFNYTVEADDKNRAVLRAGLRKNFKIDQTHTTEFDGNQTEQNTSWIVEQNSDNISTQSSRLINGKNYLFAGWEDNLALPNTRNISPVDNETYNVLYKYPHHSNSTAAYSSNSHRKFIQTPDGVKHIC